MAALVGVLVVLSGACSDGREAPAVPPPAPPPARSVFVALGGTETFGTGAGPARSWAQLLYSTRLPLGSVFVNAARPEATVAGALRNQLPLAVEQRPTLAIVWLGDGDEELGTAQDAFADDMRSLLSGLRRAGATRVLVGSPAPGNRGSRYSAQIAAAARDNGAVVVPLPVATSPQQRSPEAQQAAATAAAAAFAAFLPR